jgi:hypothetical protein
MRTMLIAVAMLGASVWVGSLVCLAVVAAASRRALDQRARVALFRQVGRLYGIVGTGALLVAIAMGLVLAWPPTTVSRGVAIEFALAALLVAVTVAGMVQARRMTTARQRLVDRAGDASAEIAVRRGAGVALALRGSIALVTLVMVVLGANLLDR